jgi:hypothetical protein
MRTIASTLGAENKHMAKFEKPETPSTPTGQEKTHTITRTLPDGTVVTKEVTQEEWRNRNKAEGWTRPEGETETESTEPTTPTTEPPKPTQLPS